MSSVKEGMTTHLLVFYSFHVLCVLDCSLTVLPVMRNGLVVEIFFNRQAYRQAARNDPSAT